MMIMTIIILIMILYIKQKEKFITIGTGTLGTEKDKLRLDTERRISYGTDILVGYGTERTERRISYGTDILVGYGTELEYEPTVRMKMVRYGLAMGRTLYKITGATL